MAPDVELAAGRRTIEGNELVLGNPGWTRSHRHINVEIVGLAEPQPVLVDDDLNEIIKTPHCSRAA